MPHAFAFRHRIQPADIVLETAALREEDTHDESDSDTTIDPDEESENVTLVESSLPLRAEDYNLFLPSGLPDPLLCATSPALREKESRIRLTLLEATFTELQRLLRVKMGLINNKRSFVVGQRDCTRAHSMLNQFTERIKQTAERYRQVRAALLRLDPNGAWTARFRILEDKDVRTPQEEPDPDHRQKKTQKNKKRKLNEGHKVISWIWRSGTGSYGIGEDDSFSSESFNDGKRKFCSVSDCLRVTFSNASRMGKDRCPVRALGGRERTALGGDGSDTIIFGLEGQMVGGTLESST
jgi:hypothetical protein